MNDGQVSVDGRTLPARGAVPGDRDAEPRGALRHLPAARVADGSLPAAHPHRLPVARGRAAHPARVARARPTTPWPRLEPVLRVADVRALQDAAERVHFSAGAGRLRRGGRRARRGGRRTWRWASRRAAQLAWRNAARAAALAEGRDYVLPDDLKSLAVPVLAHRWFRRRRSRRWPGRAGRRARAGRHPRPPPRAGMRRRSRRRAERADGAPATKIPPRRARAGGSWSATAAAWAPAAIDAGHQPLLPDVRDDGLPCSWPAGVLSELGPRRAARAARCCRRRSTRARPT